jgi:hypothetical protein
MPEGVSVVLGVINLGQITINVFQGSLDDVHGVLKLGQEPGRHEDVV